MLVGITCGLCFFYCGKIDSVVFIWQIFAIYAVKFMISYVADICFCADSWFFILAAAAISLAFIWYYPRLRRECGFLHYGCVAMVAGAIGNLIDRIKMGLVVDFLDFRIWPVFNLADIAIVVGVISMVYAILFRLKEDEES